MNSRPLREWPRDEVTELIRLYECTPCLWDRQNIEYKNKAKKNAELNNIAQNFSTTADEVYRKIHNVRSQFQNELRKIKESKTNGRGPYTSNWMYFESLKFLDFNNATSFTDLDNPAASSNNLKWEEPHSTPKTQQVEVQKVKYAPQKRKKEDISHASNRIVSESNDDDQIFGNYVASVLRNFSPVGNKKLRRIIQRTIVDIQDEEDGVAF